MRLSTQSELLKKDRLKKMKNSIYGLMMFVSVAICGGGIDSGNNLQTVIGLVMFLAFVGGILIESTREDIKNYSKRSCYHNDNSYPCFFRK